MTADVHWRDRAVEDAYDIWLHVSESNPPAANKLLDRIYAATDLLQRFPDSGSPRTEIAPEARAVVIAPYLLLYTHRGGSVHIVRVVHGHRALSQFSADFEFEV